jgi:hypothetical protein
MGMVNVAGPLRAGDRPAGKDEKPEQTKKM